MFFRFVKPNLLFFLLFAGVLSACHGGQVDPVDEHADTLVVADDEPSDSLQLYIDEPEPESADMLFADFFYAFTTDSRYQQQRVAFPLKSSDGSEETMTKATFQERAPFAPQEFYASIYDRETDMTVQNDTALSTVTVDQIHLKVQTIDRYHFHRVQGKWMLTDYDTKPADATPQASFLEFFGRFVNDTIYQRESIVFPLKLVSEAEDDEMGGEAELSEAEWPEFRDQMPLPTEVMTAIDYGQTALSENRKILLMEGASNGLFVKYKFDRTDGQWKLYEIDF